MKVKYLKFIPLQAFVELGLKPTEILFVSILVSFSKDDKTLRAGLDNISEAMGVSRNTVKRLIPRLKDKGLISVHSGYKERNANTYYPTDKLKGLYRQNVPISIDKKSAHTPKGYVTKPGEVVVPPAFSKLYLDYLTGFGEPYAQKMLRTYLSKQKIDK